MGYAFHFNYNHVNTSTPLHLPQPKFHLCRLLQLLIPFLRLRKLHQWRQLDLQWLRHCKHRDFERDVGSPTTTAERSTTDKPDWTGVV
ncbi:hypothetical protein HYC85_027334 [Camellia sinensis]|uniref:Uncharacterized protein n=1 Tax=Camellia sinensis TaxID=4442 RepID=A0A7J7G7F8_CAMSI|nr:hypothetical protein HYC85_027334 [Camellia sinensis]